MFKKTLKLLKNQKGMTLLEVLAVIVIIGIIAAISIPSIMNYIDESEAKSFRGDLSAIETAVQQVRPVASEIDYDKLKGSDNKLSEEKIKAAAQNGQLPVFDGADKKDTAIQIKFKTDAQGKVNSFTVSKGAGTGADSLQQQIADLYSAGIDGKEYVVYAYPLDMELLFVGKYLNNELRFPTNVEGTDIAATYGTKYQSEKSKDLTKIQFPTDLNKPGNFLLLDNGKVLYTGTDAVVGDTPIHTSSALVK